MENQIYVASKHDLEQLIDNAVGKALTKVNFPTEKKGFDIMNVEQLADFLNVSITTIYGKTSRNLIPFKKHGKKLYFIRAEIEKWMYDLKLWVNMQMEDEAKIEDWMSNTGFWDNTISEDELKIESWMSASDFWKN